MSFNLMRDGGPYLRDPRYMPRFYGDTGVIYRSYNAATVASSASAFWTGGVGAIDRVPGSVYITGAWSADTYRTVASVSSGSGIVSHMIGPATSSAQTVTYRVTVDGVEYTFTAATTADAERAVIGWGVPLAAYTAATTYGLQSGAASPDGFTQNINSTGLVLLGPNDARVSPGQLLLFKTSLLVEIKISGTASGSGGVHIQAGVLMQRFS